MSASRFITVITFYYVIISLDNVSSRPSPSIYDSTEDAIKYMIGEIERMISPHKRDEKAEQAAEAPIVKINPAIKKHFELQIKTLQTAPRDVGELERIIQAKEKKREEDISMRAEDIESLVTEIEMLKVVLFLVNRNSSS